MLPRWPAHKQLKRLHLESVADPEPYDSASHFSWAWRESRRQEERRHWEAQLD